MILSWRLCQHDPKYDCGWQFNRGIIAELAENKQDQNGPSCDEENQEIQAKPVPTSSEAMVKNEAMVYELRRFSEVSLM